MKRIIASVIATTALSFAASAAFAEPSCNVPKDKWMKEADFKAKAEAEGYKIKRFKVNKGQCYEIYGTDKAGKKTEAWFNPDTGASLGSKSE